MKIEKKRQYLLVDDDVTSNIICELNILKVDPQAAVVKFNDPEKALCWIREEYEPEDEGHTILFLDINMPSMTGWEFIEAFQKFKPQLKRTFFIYVLTSSIEDFSVERKKYSCINGILTKPLMREKLETLMKEEAILDLRNNLN